MIVSEVEKAVKKNTRGKKNRTMVNKIVPKKKVKKIAYVPCV
jgi:hypothetical protein